MIVEEALTIADRVLVDKLDIRESYARQSCNMTAQEFLNKFGDDPKLLWIFRHCHGDEFDIGACTMCERVDYFLWVVLSNTNAIVLARKHNLQEYMPG